MNGFVAVLYSIPDQSIAFAVYLLGSLIALGCWYGVTKRMPKTMGGFMAIGLCRAVDPNRF